MWSGRITKCVIQFKCVKLLPQTVWIQGCTTMLSQKQSIRHECWYKKWIETWAETFSVATASSNMNSTSVHLQDLSVSADTNDSNLVTDSVSIATIHQQWTSSMTYITWLLQMTHRTWSRSFVNSTRHVLYSSWCLALPQEEKLMQ